MTAANYGNNWEAQRVTAARQITQQLGLFWEFTDWQDAYDRIGVRALEILRQRSGESRMLDAYGQARGKPVHYAPHLSGANSAQGIGHALAFFEAEAERKP